MRTHTRAAMLFGLLSRLLVADPPGAMVSVKLVVPANLRNGSFGTDRQLTVPPGFQISLLAVVPGARFMALAPNGDVFVSQPGNGTISIIRQGATVQVSTYASGLRRPHSMVFHQVNGAWKLYVGESNQIDSFAYAPGDATARDKQVIVPNLPDSGTAGLGGYAHELKNIAIGPDEKLYVSIGSSCNICSSDTASNPVRGSIYQYNLDGTGGRLYAQGLRNAEGVAFIPGTNTLWAAVNNRDNIAYPLQDSSGRYGQVIQSYVDNHPPELFTAIREGGNYGWPFCFSTPDTASGMDNMPFNADYEMNKDNHVDCSKMDVVNKGIQAHSAPLGLTFLQNSAFARQYRAGAVIGLHGSWNRAIPTGYKIIYFPWNAATQTPGAQADLVTGWLNPADNSVWGRPVDAIPDQNGNLLISDDAAGAVYQLRYAPVAINAASGYATLTPGGIGSAFGSNFASQTATAQDTSLPTTLGGVGLIIKDSAGTERAATLYAVTANQINFVVPSATATGLATVTALVNGARQDLGTTYVATPAPGIFTANANGEGVAAATAVRIDASGTRTPISPFTCSGGACQATAIDLSAGTVYISLYGSGLGRDVSRVSVQAGGISVPVSYVGPQGAYPGMDQLNIALPASLAGKGDIALTVTVEGQSANEVTLKVR